MTRSLLLVLASAAIVAAITAGGFYFAWPRSHASWEGRPSKHRPEPAPIQPHGSASPPAITPSSQPTFPTPSGRIETREQLAYTLDQMAPAIDPYSVIDATPEERTRAAEVSRWVEDESHRLTRLFANGDISLGEFNEAHRKLVKESDARNVAIFGEARADTLRQISGHNMNERLRAYGKLVKQGSLGPPPR